MMKRFLSTLGALALAVGPSASLTGAQEPAGQSEAARPSLDELLTLPAGKLPSTEKLAVALLDAGPAKAGAFMDAFEKRAMGIRPGDPSLSDLAALTRRLKGVPAVIERALGHAEIPGAMRNGGVAVALEVALRDPRRLSVELVVRIVGRVDASDREGLGAVAARLTAFVTRGVNADTCPRDKVAALLRAAPKALSVSVIDGVAASRDRTRAAGLLVELMPEFHGRLDPILLNRVESIARRGSVQLSEAKCSIVRERLDSGIPFVRQEAAFAAGAIGDQRAVERLIELLGDEVSSVRDVSHASLRALTSMTISADPFRWREWYTRQTLWWDERGRLLLGRLPEAPLGELIDLVAEVSTKRLYRAEIAGALTPLLRHTDDRYVEVVLSALVNLRAPSAIPEINRLRAIGSPRLERLAADALRALKAAGIEVNLTRSSVRGGTESPPEGTPSR